MNKGSDWLAGMLLANIRLYCRKNGNVYQQKMKPTTPNNRLLIRLIKSLEIVAQMKESTNLQTVPRFL